MEQKIPLNFNGVMALAVVDLDGQSCYDTSANMNPVTMSVTFDIGQCLGNNASIMATCTHILPTFPTQRETNLLWNFNVPFFVSEKKHGEGYPKQAVAISI